jgi:hypothetical protein
MNDSIVVEKIEGWDKLKALVLDTSAHPFPNACTNMALEEFLAWVPAGASARLHQGNRERLAGIAGGPRLRLVVDHYKDVGDPPAGR